MIIRFKKSFRKEYKKLNAEQRKSVDESLKLFWKDPLAIELKNHALKGKYKNLRSISAGFDLRVLFEEKDDYVLVVMVHVGSHAQLYG